MCMPSHVTLVNPVDKCGFFGNDVRPVTRISSGGFRRDTGVVARDGDRVRGPLVVRLDEGQRRLLKRERSQDNYTPT